MRDRGTGTLYRRKDRGTWRVVLQMPDGHRQTRTAPTKAEAKELLRDMLREVDQGRRAARSPTVADFLREWLDEGVQVRPATHRRYRIIVERHLVPGLGTIRLRDLDALAVQRFLNHEKAAPRTIGHYRTVLRTALGWGQRMHLVVGNAGAETTPPRIPDDERLTLNAQQASLLIEGTKDDWLHALWVLAVTTGMREAEMLGLAWDDLELGGSDGADDASREGAPSRLAARPEGAVDGRAGDAGHPRHRGGRDPLGGRDSRGRVTVRQTLVRDKGAWAFDDPKTARSRRTIPLTSLAATALAAHKLRMGSLRTAEWKFHGLVFTTPEGNPWYGWRVLQALYAAEERLGLPRVSVHGLRHSAASMMLAQGYGLEDVKVILGHSSISTTSDVYAHPDMGRLSEVVAGMDRALGGVG